MRKYEKKTARITSVVTLRFGLQKYFMTHASVDIINAPEFKKCNDVLKAKLVKLKREGAPESKHKDPIANEDMDRLYSSDAFTTSSASGLLNRTCVEVMCITSATVVRSM